VSFVNPFELWPAFTFAVLFTMILILSKTAQMYLGNKGIYITSLISGLADVDAITLSLTQLSLPHGGLDLTHAGRAILLASVANTVLKGVLVLATGSPGLKRAILPGFLAMTGTTLLRSPA